MSRLQKSIFFVTLTCLVGACQIEAPVREKFGLKNHLPYQIKEKMNEQEFWRVINFAHEHANGDEQAQEELLVQSLTEYSLEEIVEFECLLRQYILEADNFNIIAAEKIIQGYVSDDPYLYFRCWLIGQGKQVFIEALRNPDTLAALVTNETDTDFESLLYVATQAYELKSGRQEDKDESFPRAVASKRGLYYDGTTETKGEDWTPEQLPTLLPKLWAKFN